jgi:RNA polymerase sigma-70 factor (ECF subfamily)
MRLGDQDQAQRTGFAGRAARDRGARYPGEARGLDRLPDSDILAALHALPDELQLAVYLADVEGYRYSEIALIMRTPVGTVASRLHRGRARLRDRLAAAAVQRGLAASPG